MGTTPSWGWATQFEIRTNFPAEVVGSTVDLTGTYTDIVLRDGQTSSGDLGIHVIESQDSPTWHDNDGMAIDGHIYEIDKYFVYSVTINYVDGRSIESEIVAARLVDDPDHAGDGTVGAFHTKTLFRLMDGDIPAAKAGEDGAGGRDYGPEGIESIDINSLVSQPTQRHISLFNDGFACFGKGTLIETPSGAVLVESLRIGDMVVTRDNGSQPIRWIGSRKLSEMNLKEFPQLYPICIRVGALGENLPNSDLMVSPQHRVLVRSKIAKRMFSTDEVLVAAKHLIELEGIDIVEDISDFEYFHILFDQHEVIVSNGAETESLYTGPQALESLGKAAREEIFTLFPELREQTDDVISRPPAGPLISGRLGKQIATRHNKNGQALVI